MSLQRLPSGDTLTWSANRDELLRVTRRISEDGGPATFILAHPSRYLMRDADRQLCIEWCAQHGYGHVTTLYLFPYPADAIDSIKRFPIPVGPGPDNRRLQDIDIATTPLPERGGIVIAAWGDEGIYWSAGASLLRRHDGMIGQRRVARPYPIHALGVTALGNPMRPSVAGLSATPFLYQPASVAA